VIVTSPSIAAQPWFDLTAASSSTCSRCPTARRPRSLDVLERCCESRAVRLSRDDVVVGVGGGAVTDLAGFAAATYLRGVALVQIPTSLVGQVDAAIGGKTGVNLRAGKNLVGAFSPTDRRAVRLRDDRHVARARTPERLGEVAKCWLLEGGFAAELTDVSLHDLIVMSVKTEGRDRGADEREGGRRALLNYGHTWRTPWRRWRSRATEDELRHGEAVAIGLAFAARLAAAPRSGRRRRGPASRRGAGVLWAVASHSRSASDVVD
jgi:3-dehydroquinate synthetase